MSVTINLDDLTQAHVDRCAPHIGKCSYSAPCIIGTLTGPLEDEGGNWIRISGLVSVGIVNLPPEQLGEAIALQHAFDSGNEPELIEMLAERGLKWPAA